MVATDETVGRRLTMWLIGDYILAVSMTLNGSMALAYAYDGNYPKALYWVCALGLNLSLMWMK